jgi:hypothetical protein
MASAPPVDTAGIDAYAVSSPLQYLLARIIRSCDPGGRPAHLLQYLDNGDFADAFQRIDSVIGEPDFAAHHRFRAGEVPTGLPVRRLFLSNRFNRAEVRLHLEYRRRGVELCAFEDGLALYLGHFFLNPAWDDANTAMRLKNALKTVLGDLAGRDRWMPLWFPFARFDAVYSVFPDVPGARPGMRRVALDEAFRRIVPARESGEDTLLILSQSLVSDGVVELGSYLDFLRERIAAAGGTAGRVLFKPHPRDPAEVLAQMDRLGCEPMPGEFAGVPVELYLAAYPGTRVQGFWSSTLAYAGIFGAPAASFAPLLIARQPGNDRLRSVWQANAGHLARLGVAIQEAGV